MLKFFSQLDQKVLKNYPLIWVMRLHYVLFFGLGLTLSITTLYLLAHNHTNTLNQFETFSLLSFLASLAALYWLFVIYKQRHAFIELVKQPKRRRLFFPYFFLGLLSLSASSVVVFELGSKKYIKYLVSNEEMSHLQQIDAVYPFLTHAPTTSLYERLDLAQVADGMYNQFTPFKDFINAYCQIGGIDTPAGVFDESQSISVQFLTLYKNNPAKFVDQALTSILYFDPYLNYFEQEGQSFAQCKDSLRNELQMIFATHAQAITNADLRDQVISPAWIEKPNFNNFFQTVTSRYNIYDLVGNYTSFSILSFSDEAKMAIMLFLLVIGLSANIMFTILTQGFLKWIVTVLLGSMLISFLTSIGVSVLFYGVLFLPAALVSAFLFSSIVMPIKYSKVYIAIQSINWLLVPFWGISLWIIYAFQRYSDIYTYGFSFLGINIIVLFLFPLLFTTKIIKSIQAPRSH